MLWMRPYLDVTQTSMDSPTMHLCDDLPAAKVSPGSQDPSPAFGLAACQSLSPAAADGMLRMLAQQRLHPAHWLQYASIEHAQKIATALVAAAMCIQKQNVDACGKCLHCQQIQRQSHPDSQTFSGDALLLDDIRTACSWMALRPQSACLRAIVIHDAHLLSVACQNALLKVLEEPEGSRLWILSSPHRQGGLATLRSRCVFWPLLPQSSSYLSAQKQQDLAKNQALASDATSAAWLPWAKKVIDASLDPIGKIQAGKDFEKAPKDERSLALDALAIAMRSELETALRQGDALQSRRLASMVDKLRYLRRYTAYHLSAAHMLDGIWEQ